MKIGNIQILKTLILFIFFSNNFIYSQHSRTTQGKDQTVSKLPLGYGTNHSGISNSGLWTELQPRVPRVNYWGVYFINQDTGLATGEMGAIIKSTNGGQSWYTVENSYTSTIRTIGSYSGGKIIAAGDGGLIISSTDLGETWQTVESNTINNLWNIEFVTEQTGWIVGELATALKTTDGGNTWIEQNLPLAVYAYWDVSFLDSLFGYISANGGYVLRTKDGGTNWDVTQIGDNYGLYTIQAVTRQKAVALGFAGKQVNTTDGGESWHFTTYLGSTFNNIAFIDTLNGFAAGYGGSFQSTDGGNSWEWRTDMNDGNNITFIDNETGYMVGDGLINDKTINAGESWERTIINDNFTDVYFTDENNGWFIGYQKLYQTTDGGETLIEREDFPGDRPSSVYFLDSLTGIVGAMNKIFRTTDAGISWQETNISGVTGNALEYNRLFFINDLIGWAIGLGGYIVKTTNSGVDWQRQLTASDITGIYFSDSLNGWISRGTTPFKTTDGGDTWIEQTSLPTNSLQDVYFRDSLTGFIPSSWTNNLYKTNDGGATWNIVNGITFNYGRFSNEINGQILLVGDPTYLSTDFGENWTEITEIQNQQLLNFRFLNPGLGYCIGSIGILYRYEDTTYTPVELISFTAQLKNNSVILRWNTATEVNNRGFEVERSKGSGCWKKTGFVNGRGNSTEINEYSFTDQVEQSGIYNYRLKQIDYNGSFKYSEPISVEIISPIKFKLNQNFPNPFNPITTIVFQLPQSTLVRLTIYNLLGERIKELVNKKLEAGYYNYTFNGISYPSGAYIYTLQTTNHTESRKMILLK